MFQAVLDCNSPARPASAGTEQRLCLLNEPEVAPHQQRGSVFFEAGYNLKTPAVTDQ